MNRPMDSLLTTDSLPPVALSAEARSLILNGGMGPESVVDTADASADAALAAMQARVHERLLARLANAASAGAASAGAASVAGSTGAAGTVEATAAGAGVVAGALLAGEGTVAGAAAGAGGVTAAGASAGTASLGASGAGATTVANALTSKLGIALIAGSLGMVVGYLGTTQMSEYRQRESRQSASDKSASAAHGEVERAPTQQEQGLVGENPVGEITVSVQRGDDAGVVATAVRDARTGDRDARYVGDARVSEDFSANAPPNATAPTDAITQQMMQRLDAQPAPTVVDLEALTQEEADARANALVEAQRRRAEAEAELLRREAEEAAKPKPPPDESGRRAVEAMLRAQRALAGGDARGALRELATASKKDVAGSYGPEAAMLRVRAHCMLGRHDEARAAAAELVDMAPGSPYILRLKKTCVADSSPR